MIVYNITVKVNEEIAAEWIEWQKNEHIPEIMSTGLFDSYNLFRLLNQDDVEGPTYVTQFFCSNIENYDSYILDHAHFLRKKSFAKLSNKFIAFRSLLETVQ
jgi:hypothetical protein